MPNRIANLQIRTPFSGDNAPAVRYYLENNFGNCSFTLETTGTLFSREDFAARAHAAKKAFEKETSYGSFAKKRYRFCGKERDAESPPRREESKLYYYGAWPAAAGASWTCRFLSVDPLAEERYWVTPYNYAQNNPHNRIDHFDALDGDYLVGNGEKTNESGNPDNIAYLVSGNTQNLSEGDFSPNRKYYNHVAYLNENETNPIKMLSVSNTELNIFANAVEKESGYETFGNFRDRYAIASAIVSLAGYKEKSILNTFKTERIYGYSLNSKYNGNSKESVSAVINALTGGNDYSNGAVRWNGVNFGRNCLEPKHSQMRLGGVKS